MAIEQEENLQEKKLREALRGYQYSLPGDHLFRQELNYLEDLLQIFIADQLNRSGLLTRLRLVNVEIDRLLRMQFRLSYPQEVGGDHDIVFHSSGFDRKNRDYQRLLFLLATIYDPREGLARKISDVFFLEGVNQELAELLGKSTVTFEESFYFRSLALKKYLSLFGIKRSGKFDFSEFLYDDLDWQLTSTRSLYLYLLNSFLDSEVNHTGFMISIRRSLSEERKVIHDYTTQLSLTLRETSFAAYEDWALFPISEWTTLPDYKTIASTVLQSARSLAMLLSSSVISSASQNLSNVRKKWQLLQLNGTLRMQLLCCRNESYSFYLQLITRARDQIMVAQILEKRRDSVPDSSEPTVDANLIPGCNSHQDHSHQSLPNQPLPNQPLPDQWPWPSGDPLYSSPGKEFWFWVPLTILLSVPVFFLWSYFIFRSVSEQHPRKSLWKRFTRNNCSVHWFFCRCK